MSTFRIADLSIGNATIDCSYQFEFKGHTFDVQRFGSNFSIPYMKDLIANFRNSVDAFSISDLPLPMKVRNKSFVHHQYLDVMSTPCSIPLCDGSTLKELATINGIHRAIESGKLKPENGIFFPLALIHMEAIEALNDLNAHIRMGDMYSVLGLPFLAPPGPLTAVAAQTALYLANLGDLKNQTPLASNPVKKLTRASLTEQVRNLQYVFSETGVLSLFRDDLNFIEGKDVIVTQGHVLENDVWKFNPRSITNLFPENLKFSPFINYGVLDATLRLSMGQTAPLSIEEWEKLLSVSTVISQRTRKYVINRRPSKQVNLVKTVKAVNSKLHRDRAPDFAFIVHPLSRDFIFKAPGLKLFKDIPDNWKRGVEKLAAQVPGFTIGTISHIVSKDTNEEVNGVIYALLATPKMMLSEDTEVTYRKLETICHHAADIGAKIIGLGAYTKIIGDSGETVNRNSPIPVTTGNSLSASATLWAVYDVVKRMQLLKPLKESHLLDATATVIGATGSIGKASAKLLALTVNKICLVAPRMERLEELANEIRKINPQCRVVFSRDANDFAHETDILVTATSALDTKIIEVERLKPGCVVCDCSRPLDFTPEDAAKRPDVLIIESGEVVLPGPVDLTCDIGLPDKVVYACLGETALLAMEKRYEPFTLGRNIDYLKVKEIYKMANRHGVELAAVRGHLGLISEREIELTKKLALEKLQHWRQ
ncbi:MAG: dehydrogenase [Oligoflexia bacterium]|nr:dehydrogenase [Oligoflexia bacterium]